MPDVRSSRVVERAPAAIVVEQEAVARVFFFSKRVHLVLEVHAEPGRIRFRDRCGQSFTRYEGVVDAVRRGTATPSSPTSCWRGRRSTSPSSSSPVCSSATPTA